jgi:hypothetical protein
VLVYPRGESTEVVGGRSGSLTVHRLIVGCEMTANLASAGQAADAALDPYFVWFVDAVCGKGDTLGTGVNGVRYVGAEWDADMKERTYARARYDFEVSYQTGVGNASVKTD